MTLYAAIVLVIHVAMASSASDRSGAVVYLTDGNPDRVGALFRSLRSLDYHVNSLWHYPVIVFYEDSLRNDDKNSPLLTESQRLALQAATRSQLIFSPVDFSAYSQAPGVADAPTSLWGKSVGYRHMCRFFAGTIAYHPALRPYRYYLRLDVDTVLLSSLSLTDIFEDMAVNAWRYGHGALQCDWPTVTDGLWELAASHFGPVALQAPFRDTGCKRSGDAGTSAYNNRIYYNNFEVVDLEFLRSARYQGFFDAVDAAGGIYTKRWGDAVVRTIAVQALLPPIAVHHFNGALYWHQGLHGIDWSLLGTGLFVAACLLCTLTGFCAAPLVGKVLVARAFPVSALRLVRIWRSAAALTMDAVLCISCGGCCHRQKRPRDDEEFKPNKTVAGSSRSSAAATVGKSGAASPGRSGLAEQSAFAIRRTSSLLSARSGAAVPRESFAASFPVFIPQSPNPGSRSAVQLASDRKRARRFALIAVMATVVLTALGFLTSRSRIDYLINGGSSAAAIAARRCYSDDLPCLLEAVADGRRRIVLTVASSGVMPLLYNLIASWRRLGAASTDVSLREAVAEASRPVGAPRLGGAQAVDNFLVVALDSSSFHELRDRGIPVYWDPAPIDQLNSAPQQLNLLNVAGSGLPSERATSGALLYGTSEFNALLRHIHVLMHRVIERGFHVFFSDADTVWLANPLDEVTWGAEPDWQLQDRGGVSAAVDSPERPANPILGHTCARLRLGDVVSPSGDQVDPALVKRSDCRGGVGGQWMYDAIGMYGDTGGLDPGYSYLRATNRTLAHLDAVLAFQNTLAAQSMHNQETFNSVLEPWRGVSPQEFGPARLRVALFDPMIVPNGCRLDEALRRGVSPVVVHANCRTGLLAKGLFFVRHGYWFVRFWDDRHVSASAVCMLGLIALRTARLLARARSSKAARNDSGLPT